MLVDPETKKPTRVGFRVRDRRAADGAHEDRARVRVAKRSGKDI